MSDQDKRASITVLAVALALASFPAPAQAPIAPEFIEGPPAELARDAFDTEYGRKLVARFVALLRKTAAPACLRSRGLSTDVLENSGREILVRSGTRMFEVYMSFVDGTKMEAAFLAEAGRDAKQELTSLRDDPQVARLMALGEPAQLAKIADTVVENVDRHALLAHISLGGNISPLATGDIALLDSSPEQKSIDDVERFMRDNESSPQLKRWIELHGILAAARERALNTNGALRLGPRQLTDNLEPDLAAICIRPRSR